MSFKRTIEDFVCENCGYTVRGSGYTNHCPRCLWSKHVDVEPGDRQERCGGLMQPTRLEGGSPEYTIVHRCVACGIEKRNRTQAEDSPEMLLTVAARGPAS